MDVSEFHSNDGTEVMYIYVIDEELQHADHLFLGVACFAFLNFV
jgi:hypothetical protein